MPNSDNYSYEDDDRYVYSGTDVLVNLFGIKDQGELSSVERSLSGVRYAELEDVPIEGGLDLEFRRRWQWAASSARTAPWGV